MTSLRNLLGAFGDAAILFPILVLLNKAGLPMTPLLLSTGIVYVFAAFFYRMPMPVQPLKSIALAAVSVGASFNEIRVAGFCVGIFCLTLLFLPNLETSLKKVPIVFIHQLQVGLGLLLIGQALKTFGVYSFVSMESFIVLFMVIGLVVKPEFYGVPVLGIVATSAFVLGLVKGAGTIQIQALSGDSVSLRWGLIVALVLPQMALTMGNSVLSTKNICDRMYPKQSHLVTFRRMLSVIGIGNLLMACWGGMPFCHGSGGLTAHQRAGANHWWSTAFIGAVLTGLALVFRGERLIIIPPVLLTVLLATVGVFHLRLAQVSWVDRWGKVHLIGAFILVALTQNLLLVFPVFVLVEIFKKWEARYGILS